MGRRGEQRIVTLIPVTVRGTDASGIPFELAAETCDVSVMGARLRGLSGIAAPGKKIEVECKNKKAWYRIQWVGQPRTLSGNQFGIRLLEPEKYIWGIPSKKWAEDTFDASQLATYDRGATFGRPQKLPDAAPVVEERRRHIRVPFRIETRVTSDFSSIGQTGTITDVSFGGCYVETLGPLPVNAEVGLDLKVGKTVIHLSGIVRSSQSGFGMGIEFSGISNADRDKFLSIITIGIDKHDRAPSASPATLPKIESARDLYQSIGLAELLHGEPATIPEVIEAAIRVLYRKKFLTPAELAEEIEALKTAKVEPGF